MCPALTPCPVCEKELVVSCLHCPLCDTSINGKFTTSHFANLSHEQLNFIVTFVRCEGKINRVEDELKLSYPTIRNRLREVIRASGFEPGKADSLRSDDEKRRVALVELEAGKINADYATRMLRGDGE